GFGSGGGRRADPARVRRPSAGGPGRGDRLGRPAPPRAGLVAPLPRHPRDRRHRLGVASPPPRRLPRPRPPRRPQARRRPGPRMKTIAYVVPTYPMPSQTFIRPEAAALEARGWTIHRFAMRRYDRDLAEPADRAERDRTEYILDAGAAGLAQAVVVEALGRPRRWLAALATALRMGHRSEKGLAWHL